jgi:hypothetical protein
MPWVVIPDLQDVEECVVDDVKFNLGPPTLCTPTLRLLSGPCSGAIITFSFRQIGVYSVNLYFDKICGLPVVSWLNLLTKLSEGEADFLVLKSRFEAANQFIWQRGCAFRSLLPGRWAAGRIASAGDRHQAGLWRSMAVVWEENGRGTLPDRVSPWDIEPPGPDNLPSVYAPVALDLNATERILRGLKGIIEVPLADSFVEEVDYQEYPDYLTKVFLSCIDKFLIFEK